MVRIESRRVALSAALGALGVLTLTTMPMASADPVPLTPDPNQPVAAQPVPAQPVAAAPVAAQPVAAAPPVAEGVPHLPSPDNLPPGTTEDPTGQQQGHGLSYLRDLWHAVQTQNVSGSDALLLLTQRPMDADATPPAGMPTGPQPVAPAAGPAPAPLPPVDPAAVAPAALPAPAAEVLPVPVPAQ